MSKPPVLLIHGVGSSFDHGWRVTGWVDMLESEGRTVIGVHLPGHGPDPEFEPGDTGAARILAVAADYETVDAVGFSAGGHALLVAASEQPAKFRRIAVLGVGDPVEARAQGRGTEGGAELDIVGALEADDEPTEGLPRIFRRLVDSAGNDRFKVAQFLRSPSPTLTLAAAEKVSGPALVIIGDQDFVGPADALVAALPEAELITLAGVDHFSTPSNFGSIDAVLRFFD